MRHATLEAGENKSGHISAGPHEGILFFDSVFFRNIPFLHLMSKLVSKVCTHFDCNGFSVYVFKLKEKFLVSSND